MSGGHLGIERQARLRWTLVSSWPRTSGPVSDGHWNRLGLECQAQFQMDIGIVLASNVRPSPGMCKCLESLNVTLTRRQCPKSCTFLNVSSPVPPVQSNCSTHFQSGALLSLCFLWVEMPETWIPRLGEN